jgi:hypothetical protein
MTDGLFTTNSVVTIDPNKDYTQELVGEGKRYASVQELARAALEKELHIKNVEADNKEMREDLTRRATAEEILAKIQSSNTNTTLSQPVQTGLESSSEPLLTKEQLNALIQKQVSDAVTGMSAEAEAKKNIDLVKSTLTKTWGDDYTTKLKEKAQELGVSEDWITQTARTTPKVLLSLVQGTQTPQESLFVPTPSGINTAGLLNTSANNLPQEAKYSYWKKLRETNPKDYYSIPKTAARHDAAKKYGDAFLNN